MAALHDIARTLTTVLVAMIRAGLGSSGQSVAEAMARHDYTCSVIARL